MAVERTVEQADGEAPRSPWGPELRQFSADDYYKMAEVGILGERERVELIEGVIVKMPPIGPEHADCVDGVAELLGDRLRPGVRVRVQNPIHLAERAEPEPDIAVVRRVQATHRPYRSRHPGLADVYLVVEISDSTREFDLGGKAEMYARYGVPELWVVDLQQDRLVVHREPMADGYGSVESLERGTSLSPLAFPDVVFAADEILG